MRYRIEIAQGIAIWAILIIIYLLYSPGFSGEWQFDDASSLSGLERVSDFKSALSFAIAGDAGLLGRPLALMTFALQSPAWPNAPGDFIRINALIHLACAVFVAWMILLIGEARGVRRSVAVWIAVACMALWASLPILASSNLFVIQRMTTVSALFLLAGVVAYLKSRALLDKNVRKGLLLMTASIAVFGGMALLSKENGALLPLYLFAIEWTVLKAPRSVGKRKWALYLTLVMLIPMCVIVLYLLRQIPYAHATIVSRHFDVVGRLAAETNILAEYLRLAFLPIPQELGPFQDHYAAPVERGGQLLLNALIGFSVLAIAFVYRNRFPLGLFACTWFLIGHLLESTTIPLELYFEHRNYVPILGPVYFFIGTFAEKALGVGRCVFSCLFVMYLIVIQFVLYGQTSLWGNPRLAAEMWHINNPNSIRAVLYLAEKLENEGELAAVRRLFSRFLESNPDAQQVRLQGLIYSCFDNSVELRGVADFRVNRVSTPIGFSTHASRVPEKLYELKSTGRCEGVSEKDIARLAKSLLEVPEVAVSTVATHNLYSNLAVIAINRNDFSLARHYLERALEARFNIDTMEVAILVAAKDGRFDDGVALLRRAVINKPLHPLRAIAWRIALRRVYDRLSNKAVNSQVKIPSMHELGI